MRSKELQFKWLDWIPDAALTWITLMSGAASLAREVIGFSHPNQAQYWFGLCARVCFVLSAGWTVAKERRKTARMNQQLLDERNKKDGPLVMFDYTGGSEPLQPKRPLTINELTMPPEQYISLKNTGSQEAFDVEISEIQNGRYSAEFSTVPRLPVNETKVFQVYVRVSPNGGGIIGGMMDLLEGDGGKKALSTISIMPSRRFPVAVTYRDILNRRYRTTFEIEYFPNMPFARTFFIQHEILGNPVAAMNKQHEMQVQDTRT